MHRLTLNKACMHTVEKGQKRREYAAYTPGNELAIASQTLDMLLPTRSH